jgi:hypothetical protein
VSLFVRGDAGALFGALALFFARALDFHAIGFEFLLRARNSCKAASNHEKRNHSFFHGSTSSFPQVFACFQYKSIEKSRLYYGKNFNPFFWLCCQVL